MIVLSKVPAWWVSVFALLRIGAIPVPGTSLLAPKDLKYRAVSSGITAFIGDNETCTRFDVIAKEVNVDLVFQVRQDNEAIARGRIDLDQLLDQVPANSRFTSPTTHFSNDLAFIYYTSGTTSLPKQVLIESHMLLGHVLSGVWYRLELGSYFSNAVDLGWAKASYWTFGGMNLGATLFVQPPAPGPFDPRHTLIALNKYPIAVMCCPPTIYRSLVTTEALEFLKKNPPMSLRHCVGAGEPLNASVIKTWKAATGGIEIADGYGQTETVIVVGNWQGLEVRAYVTLSQTYKSR